PDFFFQAEDGIRRDLVTGVQTCALPILSASRANNLFQSSSVSSPSAGNALSRINHIVVIYEENHSFDNLYGGWEGVNGLDNVHRSEERRVGKEGHREGAQDEERQHYRLR